MGSQVLEIALGLFFVYLFFSIICSAVNEFIAWLLHLRARTLKSSLRKFLEDPADEDLVERIYDHPLVAGLTNSTQGPAYIPSHIFAVALLEVAMETARTNAAPAASPAGTAAGASSPAPAKILNLADLRIAAISLAGAKANKLGKVLVALLDESVGNLKDARANLESWLNDAMSSVAGVYKRRSYLIVLGVALVVTLGMNVDTIHITKALWTDGNLRASLAAQAEAFRQANSAAGLPDTQKALTQVLGQIQLSELPIGWHSWADFCGAITRATSLLGLLLTTVAISFGAPFWFDMLNKISNLRASGKPPENGGRATQSGSAVTDIPA